MFLLDWHYYRIWLRGIASIVEQDRILRGIRPGSLPFMQNPCHIVNVHTIESIDQVSAKLVDELLVLFLGPIRKLMRFPWASHEELEVFDVELVQFNVTRSCLKCERVTSIFICITVAKSHTCANRSHLNLSNGALAKLWPVLIFETLRPIYVVSHVVLNTWVEIWAGILYRANVNWCLLVRYTSLLHEVGGFQHCTVFFILQHSYHTCLLVIEDFT